jgi:hypothetical protein
MENMENFHKTLKWKELAELEDYLDAPMDEWNNLKSKAKLAFAMQYIIAKRNNPSLTIGDAEGLTIEELGNLAGLNMIVPEENQA